MIEDEYIEKHHTLIVSRMKYILFVFYFFFSSRRRHTRWNCDWSSDVCSSDLHRPGLRTWLCLGGCLAAGSAQCWRDSSVASLAGCCFMPSAFAISASVSLELS